MDDECVILSSEVVIYSGYNFLFFPACVQKGRRQQSQRHPRAVLGQDTPNASASLFFSSAGRKKEGLFVCQEINPWVKGWTGDGSHVLFGGNQFSSFFNLLGFWFFVET